MRKLFLLPECETETINTELQALHQQCPELIVLSPDPNIYLQKPLSHAKSLLGKTLNWIVLDCRQGFPLDYFLCAANTIQNNGAFMIIWQPNSTDEQSSRFHTEQIPTNNFQRYLSLGLERYSQIWHNDDVTRTTLSAPIEHNLTTSQQQVLNALQAQTAGITTLFAPRGTGKSFVVAEFLKTLSHNYIITAPNQNALQSYTNIPLNFMAPDYLFLNHESISQSWLIIEEAAQMPIAHLEKLSKLTDNVLLISSVENYEGTGKGLESKLADIITIDRALTLSERQRFEANDPLAQFCNYISLQGTITTPLTDGTYLYSGENLSTFQNNFELVQHFYQFMNQYHYQTNAQDIRRLFDSPDATIIITVHNHQIVGGIWAIHEGELPQSLAEDVFNGYRRPKGNLVVQTLAAHSYYPELMTLKSLRISRIAVDATYRHQGIAKSLLNQLINFGKTHEYDFLSTSFGLTASLLRFWQQCEFTWIHLGSHRDKTTGLHAAILLFPLTDTFAHTIKAMQRKWHNDAFHLSQAPFIHSAIRSILREYQSNGRYDALDQRILEAHHHHKKPVEAAFSALERQKLQLD